MNRYVAQQNVLFLRNIHFFATLHVGSHNITVIPDLLASGVCLLITKSNSEAVVDVNFHGISLLYTTDMSALMIRGNRFCSN